MRRIKQHFIHLRIIQSVLLYTRVTSFNRQRQKSSRRVASLPARTKPGRIPFIWLFSWPVTKMIPLRGDSLIRPTCVGQEAPITHCGGEAGLQRLELLAARVLLQLLSARRGSRHALPVRRRLSWSHALSSCIHAADF